MEKKEDLDIVLAMTIRAALIMMVRAIEKRYGIKRYDFDEKIVPIGENDSITGVK